jgi:Luciferase-like monooxygenase
VIRGVWSRSEFTYDGAGIAAHGLDANPKPDPHPPLWIGGNSRQSRRRVARYADGWTPFPAPKSMSRTTKTPPLETVEDLTPMLEELWRFVEEAGRDRDGIDVAFATHEGGAPGSARFQPDEHRQGLDHLASLGVTWASTSVPADSLEHALEALEQYGETVITPSRA